MFDLFANYSLEEILRVNSLFMMGMMILLAVFAMGAASEEWGGLTKPARVSSKKYTL